jgi:hypothetical protein
MANLIDGLREAKRRATFGVGKRWNNWEASRYDRRRKVDTSGKASMAQMGMVGAIAEHGTGFQSVNEGHLRKVFETMNFPLDAGFVDIGSGKGKPVIIAAEYGFSPVTGVEVTESLCTIAAKNLQSLGLIGKARIECANAVEYEFGSERVVFLNNPFDAEFFKSMVASLSAAAAGLREPVWLLYGNPVWRRVLDERSDWEGIRDFHFFGPGRDIVVYRYIPALT